METLVFTLNIQKDGLIVELSPACLYNLSFFDKLLHIEDSNQNQIDFNIEEDLSIIQRYFYWIRMPLDRFMLYVFLKFT